MSTISSTGSTLVDSAGFSNDYEQRSRSPRSRHDYTSHSARTSRIQHGFRSNTRPSPLANSSPSTELFSSQYPVSSTSRSRPTRTTSSSNRPHTASILSRTRTPQHDTITRSELDEDGFESTEAGGPHIVLAIDYGTTFSGLAWMHTDGETPTSLNDLQLLQEWPGKQSQKVPSTFSYDLVQRGRPRRQQWGYDIDDSSAVIRWAKSRLKLRNPKHELEALRELIEGLGVPSLDRDVDYRTRAKTPAYLSKSPSQVVKDYLSKVAKRWYDVMKRQGMFTLEYVPIDIVITHPTNWQYEAMNSTYQAVVAAFPEELFKNVRHITLSPESESCALYTIQELLSRDSAAFVVGECFIICDAGGGTIDLGSYRIDQVNPLQLTRVGMLTGDDFGATLIDKAFLDWMRLQFSLPDLLPDAYERMGLFVMNGLSNTMVERFQEIKHQFTGLATERPYQLELPRLEVFGDQDTIDVPPAALRQMFDTSVERVLQLIEDQYDNTVNFDEGNGIPNHVANIFMAGGFSDSRYLIDQVTEFANQWPDVQVHKANDCWSSVVKGGVLRGMGLGMRRGDHIQRSQVHVGICLVQLHQVYQHGVNIESESTKDDFYGDTVVSDQISWLVQKGDVIPPGNPIRATRPIRIDFNVYEHKEDGCVSLRWVVTRRDRVPVSIHDDAGLQFATVDIFLQDLSWTASKSSKTLLHPREHRSEDAKAVVSVGEHSAVLEIINHDRIVAKSSIDLMSLR